MGQAALQLSRSGLGERLLDLLTARIQTAGGPLTISTKTLAEEVGAKPAAVAYQLHRLAQRGHISTAAAGPKGTTIQLGESKGPQVVRRGSSGVAKSATRTTTNFCPWCGRKAQDRTWHYCPTCGQQLP